MVWGGTVAVSNIGVTKMEVINQNNQIVGERGAAAGEDSSEGRLISR